MESSHPFLFFGDLYLVESSWNIQLGELFCLSNLVQGFINQGQWVMVLLCKCIQGLVVHIKLEATFRFLYEEYWSGGRWVANLYKVFVKQICQSFSENHQFFLWYAIQRTPGHLRVLFFILYEFNFVIYPFSLIGRQLAGLLEIK